MTETITVYYEPLGTVDGVTFYHENLVYTNSQGQTFLTSAYATNANANAGGTSGILANFTSAAADAATNTPSLWGTLTSQGTTNVAFNSTNAASSKGIIQDGNGNYYASEVVASGASFASQWATINSAETSTANDILTYSPLTQNSNSDANSALQLAGITPPTDTGMLSAHWAPAAGTDLTFSCFKDGSGDTVLDLSDNGTTNTMDLVTSPSGSSTNVTTSSGSLVDDAEAAVTNPDGSQTDDVTGYNANGSTKFTQDTTTTTNGQVSATITGQGDSDYTSGASIALAANAVATVAGSTDTIAAQSGDTVTVQGVSDTVSLSGIGTLAINSTGAGTLTAGSATDTFGANALSSINDAGSIAYFNLIAGGSDEIKLNPLSGSTSLFAGFSGTGGTGTNTFDTYDYTGGYSQKQLFTGLPGGDSEQINSYSGLNLTGSLGSTIWNQSAGTSQIDLFNPSSGITSDLESFTGLNGTGTDNNNVVDFTNNTSQYQQLTGLPSGDKEIVDSYSGLNDIGTLLSTIWDYISNASLIELFNPTNQIATQVGSYTGLNGAGTDTYNVLNYDNSTSLYEQLTGLQSGGLENLVGYSGAGLTGSERYTISDYTNQTSWLEIFNPTSGVNNVSQDFTQLNGLGTLTEAYIYNANNTSIEVNYDYENNAQLTQDNFYQGSTDLGQSVFALSGQFLSGYNPGTAYAEDTSTMDDNENFDPYDAEDDGSGSGDYGNAVRGGGSLPNSGTMLSSSNTSITLTPAELATLTGGGDAVTLSNGSTLTTAFSSLFNSITLSGSNAVLSDGGSEDAVTLAGASDSAILSGDNMNKTAVTVSGTNATLEFSSDSNDAIVFGSGASGTLKLDYAPGFTGTVAGLTAGDTIDLGSFLFSGTPTVNKVTGSGGAGTVTDVTLTDGLQTATLALLNQYANQFAVKASAYTLTADSTSHTAGTLFQLAASH